MAHAAEEPSRSTSPQVPASAFAGRLLVLSAALLWSSGGLFAKAPIFADWTSDVRGPLLAFWRAAFAAAVLWPLVRRPRWRRGLVPLCVMFTGMNVTYLTALTLTTAANAIWLQSTAPWWVFLIGILLLREQVARRDLIPLGFGMVGVGLILLFEVSCSPTSGAPGIGAGYAQSLAGVAMGVASGVTYAGVVVCMRRMRNENSVWLVALTHTVTVIVLLPWVIYLGCWPSPAQLAVLAVFGVVQMAIPYVLLIQGLRRIVSQEAVAIGLAEPILLPLWVFLAWGEIPAWWTAVGASLILAGLVIRYGGIIKWEPWKITTPSRSRCGAPGAEPD